MTKAAGFDADSEIAHCDLCGDEFLALFDVPASAAGVGPRFLCTACNERQGSGQ